MNVLIIEDEKPAQIQLERLLNSHFPEMEIVNRLDSVTSSVEWLKNNSVDIIFMDVELSDGQCFEIFKQVKVNAPVIITTAYNEYAIKAFKVNSIDYLLKPIDQNELIEAVNKAKKATQKPALDLTLLENLLQGKATKEYKQRFTIKLGDKILLINASEVAYFQSEEKATFIVTHEGKRYIADFTLDAIESSLNPKDFFRMTRGVIANIQSVKSVSKYFNSRLKVTLNPPTSEQILVSRVKIPLFLSWLEGEL
ncbi:MAG: LytTR family DNA-binding domain-containing protein [Bacteroidota bacterium]|nr:LytTR family DNA-binding domain-containing protein [Bacteroidota bacterium]